MLRAADRRGVPAAARSGVQGLRRVARRRRGARNRLGHGLRRPCCCPAAGPAPISFRTTSRSSSPRRRSRSGRRAPTSSACTGSRRAAGCATCSPGATGSAAAGSGSGSTTASTARGRWSGAATPSSSTPASSRRAAPCRSARSPSRSCTAAGPSTRFVLFGQADDARAAVRVRAARRRPPEVLAWRYSEATVGLCLSLTNYSLIPQEMMACGLPCVDLAGGSTEAEIGRARGL